MTEPRVIRFRPGQRRQTWSSNCVAIGLSSGFLEPLESTSIHLIQRGIIRLMQMFPRDGICQADIDEYNQQTRDRHRAHPRLHHPALPRHQSAATRRSGATAASMDMPASLRHRIELFRETGRVFRVPDELFAENSWIQVMLGQGIMPKQHHPVADLMGDAELARFLDGIGSSVDKAVRQLPTHQAYIEKYCGAPGMRAAAL